MVTTYVLFAMIQLNLSGGPVTHVVGVTSTPGFSTLAACEKAGQTMTQARTHYKLSINNQNYYCLPVTDETPKTKQP